MKQIKKPVFGLDYNPGDALFMHNDGNAISEGISFFESLDEETTFGEMIGDPNEEPGHVVMVISKTQGIHSSIGGVQICELKQFFDNPRCMVVVRKPLCMHPITFDQAYQKAVSMIGQQYGYSAILGAMLSILSPLDRWFPGIRKWPLFLGGDNIPTCSQFYGSCYQVTDQYGDAMIFKDYHVTRIFPNVLWNHFPWEKIET